MMNYRRPNKSKQRINSKKSNICKWFTHLEKKRKPRHRTTIEAILNVVVSLFDFFDSFL